ncbi:P-loop containing nucleoside triphosphate hydrolase protein [Testicularia cyperi]|uniref:P-loop containing nucleoside triphosphate hydrolase protein n=1 Tax=Testicularia cyperi TaxID=1882483 RepID=A0A317XT31_9BASI|nr:P-loop containing nucleoside triphosphate hydrolase protein [Testicularia cyperi]
MEAMRRKIMEEQLAAIEEAKRRQQPQEQQQQQQHQQQSSTSSSFSSLRPNVPSGPIPTGDGSSRISMSHTSANPAITSIAPRNKHAAPPRVKLYQPLLNQPHNNGTAANGSSSSSFVGGGSGSGSGTGTRNDPIVFGQTTAIQSPARHVQGRAGASGAAPHLAASPAGRPHSVTSAQPSAASSGSPARTPVRIIPGSPSTTTGAHNNASSPRPHHPSSSQGPLTPARQTYTPFVPPSLARQHEPSSANDNPFLSPLSKGKSKTPSKSAFAAEMQYEQFLASPGQRSRNQQQQQQRAHSNMLDENASYGLSIDAETRDKQLLDMVNNMVSVPDLPAKQQSQIVIPGLKCSLLTHQVQGVTWMKERERGAAKGGILADDMGLGKTVQTLALLLSNRPGLKDSTIDLTDPTNDGLGKKGRKAGKAKSQSPSPQPELESQSLPMRSRLTTKTTLIVAPLAVIRQWEREVSEKTDAGLKVYVYHGARRVKTAAAFAKYDIVITTYTTAASEYKHWIANAIDAAEPERNIDDSLDAGGLDTDSDSASDDFRGTSKSKTKKKPVAKKPVATPLFDFDWLRIVLDEAQNIKNRKAKCSLACFRLSQRSVSRWCLTGTPIQNDAYEMHSLVHFLRIPPFDDYEHFKDKIGEPLKSTNQNRVNWGMKRLCFLLQTIMLRRTKDAKTAEGAPILTLPGRTIELIELEFDSPQEREFYEGLESRLKNTMQEEADRHMQKGTKASFIQTLILLLRLRQACSHPSLVLKSVREDAGAITAGSSATKSGPTAATSKMKKSAADDSDDEFVDAESGNAMDDDDDGLAAMLSSMSVGTRRCEQCHTVLPPPPTTSLEDSKPGVPSNLCEACSNASVRQDPRLFSADTSSTKTRKMLELLSKIRRDDPTEKTIVFSQFTTFLDVVERHLQAHSFRYVRYDGRMRPQEREAALDRIRSDAATTVILISFKAGSTGLNLTCCSRVILMDLWWNPQIEEQAFDRAHRLGQTRDVVIYKLSIKDTVEERILHLQGRKRELAKAALEGSKLTKGNKLDSREIWFLFNGQF